MELVSVSNADVVSEVPTKNRVWKTLKVWKDFASEVRLIPLFTCFLCIFFTYGAVDAKNVEIDELLLKTLKCKLNINKTPLASGLAKNLY